MAIRVTFNTPNPERGAQQPKTPMVGAGSLVATRNGELREVITVRTYISDRGTGMQPVRACVWIVPAGGGQRITGRGDAGGSGYHRESAAIADALDSAGVQIWGDLYSRREAPRADYKKRVDFGGMGSSGYADIFKAVARAAGYRGRMVWVSHGL